MARGITWNPLLDIALAKRCIIKASPSSEAVNILNRGVVEGEAKGKY